MKLMCLLFFFMSPRSHPSLLRLGRYADMPDSCVPPTRAFHPVGREASVPSKQSNATEGVLLSNPLPATVTIKIGDQKDGN